jgi:hypothetical protein
MKTTLAYIFGVYITAIYIYMSFISRTMNKDRYKYRIIFSTVCLLFGLLIDFLQIFNEPKGFFTLLSFAPFIYLIYYELLRYLMLPWIGKFPYTPHWEKIGNRIIGKGYPKNRVVTKSDYVFRVALFYIPFLTLVILIVIIDK